MRQDQTHQGPDLFARECYPSRYERRALLFIELQVFGRNHQEILHPWIKKQRIRVNQN